MLGALLLLFWSVHYGAMAVEQMDPAWLILIAGIAGGFSMSTDSK